MRAKQNADLQIIGNSHYRRGARQISQQYNSIHTESRSVGMILRALTKTKFLLSESSPGICLIIKNINFYVEV